MTGALGAASLATCAGHLWAGVSLNQISSTNWTISNGLVTAIFSPSGEKITSVQLGSGTNLLTSLDQEFAGTPFGGGTQSFNSQVGPGGSYVDVWTNVASAGTAQTSGCSYINPITYAFHYLIYANDPTIYCYEVLNHSATDPATSVGQGQFLFRSNPSLFPNLYQINSGPNQQYPVTTLNIPSTNANWGTVSVQAGRTVQNAAVDLTGSGIPGDAGTNFFTKYDYSIYSQFFQAETMYGSSYAVTEIDPSRDTLTGGPTKQELAYTDPGILNMEFLSGHYGNSGNGAGPFPGYSYYPAQGADVTKLYGPYAFTISSTTGTTAAAINQKAISSIPTQQAQFSTDTELVSVGYVAPTARGTVQITGASNAAGWSSNSSNNTVVLSQPGVNFQESTQGYQYWGQLNQSGSATISNVVPGTYRLSLYQLGQWGETRVDGVQVNGNTITLPQNLKFTPQNFSSAAPIWSIGTPNRSANEFLNGHNSSGADIRAFYGSYDYWAQEAALGSPGKVVYYATNLGATPATNDSNKWLANQWGKFNPGLYDASNGTSDNYNKTCPAYVTAGGGPANYGGSAWEIHFATSTAQSAQGQYVVLSVGLAAAEGSLTIALNGHSEGWHVVNSSDPMIRSGEAGYYQFLAYQFPTSDLNASGSDNTFTLSTSQPDGDLYDALRLEITNTSAAPSSTGWYDYEYIYSSNSQTDAADANGTAASSVFSGTSQWAMATGGSWSSGGSWSNFIIPNQPKDIATFASTITAPSVVTLDGNHTLGGLIFNSPQSYTLAAGTGGLLTFNAGTGTSTINVLSGTHTIAAPIALQSNLLVTVTNASDSIILSGGINGSGGLTTGGNGAVSLSGVNTYSGPTQVTAGTLTLMANGSITSTAIGVLANASFNVNGVISPATALTTAGIVHIACNSSGGIFVETIGSASLSGSALITLQASAAGSRTLLVTNALTFAGASGNWQGRVDLNNNDVLIHNGSLGDLTSEISAGYGSSGAWNGSSGLISSIASANPAHLLAIGIMQSTSSAFDGVATSPGDVLVKVTYFGDANLDGKVDGSDYSLIDYGYLSDLSSPLALTGWANGDFNYDGNVNGSDYTLIDNAFNTQGTQITASVTAQIEVTSQIGVTGGQVPEPALLSWGAAIGIASLRRRTR